MSLRGVQRQAAARYSELGSDLSSTLRPHRPQHRTSELPTTARLLRNSRLFSLPKPLQRPDIAQVTGLRTTIESDTATLPYPTHAAIVTHAKSFGRGDWGLKRALPRKAFKTTTPVVRVKQVDSIDHITEFESAADHVFTLQKVQELSIPVIVPKAKELGKGSRNVARHKPPTSAFDAFADPKDVPEQGVNVETRPQGWGVAVAQPNQARRWRYDSPWIAGMPPGEFETYLHSTIKSKRSEFRAWLRQKVAERRSQTKQRRSSSINVDAGISASQSAESKARASQIIAEVSQGDQVPAKDSLEEDILDLRNHPRELFMLVWEFFDMPGRFPSAGKDMNDYASDNVDVERGPPTTHPSAGLSYLRPVRHLYNHPALGPMAQPPPVPARVLQRGSGSIPQILGVAGIAVERPTNDFSTTTPGDPGRNVKGLKMPGGPKMYAHARAAEIDSKGGIRLDIIAAHQDQIDVWHPKPDQERVESKRAWGERAVAGGSNQMPSLRPMEDYKRI